MKIAVKHPLTGFLAALAVAVLANWWSVGMVRDSLETGKVARMIGTMKTVCVGRFLIDVPAEARVSFRGAFLSGWNISIYPDETDEQFFARLADQEAELKGAKNRAGGENLESTIGVDREGVHGKIFVFGRTWTHWIEDGKRLDSTAVAVHAYVHTQRTSLNFTAKSLDEDDTRELAKIVRQVKPLKEGEVPTEPGFCFGRAMIKDPLLASQNERVTMFLSLKDHPDFVIAFYTAAGLKPGKSLLARDDAIKQEFEAYVHTFRRGGRSIAGIPGDEICERFNEKNGTTAHSCEWEAVGVESNLFRPDLMLDFSTGHSLRPGGKPVESSLTDDAVLALWDKMSSSIRVRPTKAVRPSVAAPVVPEIGSGVSAYEACPASGWWQCYDGKALGEVEHGDTQFFRHGVRMPQATLLVPPTLWQRIKRERPTFQHEAPTYWKLVRHDPPLPPVQPDIEDGEGTAGQTTKTAATDAVATDPTATVNPGNDGNEV